jgi:hypothetical protein
MFFGRLTVFVDEHRPIAVVLLDPNRIYPLLRHVLIEAGRIGISKTPLRHEKSPLLGWAAGSLWG